MSGGAELEHAVEIPAYRSSEEMLWDLLLDNMVNYTTGGGKDPRWVFLRDSDGSMVQRDGTRVPWKGIDESLRLLAACGWDVVRMPYSDEQRPRVIDDLSEDEGESR